MHKLIYALVLVLLSAGCSKTVDQMKENAVISAMTNGQWKITSFIDDGANITSQFSDYSFQYHSNKTVDAIKNGLVEKSGTWDGDAIAMTIAASFQSAANPLNLINGTWHIDRNSWTYVEASLRIGTTTRTLRLDKL